MNPHDTNPARTEPGTSGEVAESPPGAGKRPAPPRQQPDRRTPDKEGGAPVDELDLDGDGARRQ
jgi:hypothetical protein